MLIDTLLLTASVLLLWFGAKYLIDAACKIAETLGVSELVIGLTVVAFGTSAPEFAVTITAAVQNYADISVGNIVGSNNFNLGFILGTIAIIKGIQIPRKLVYRDGIFLIGIAILILIFFRNLKLERWEGIVLFTTLVVYLLFLFLKKESVAEEEISHEKSTLKDIIILPISITAVIVGGLLLVESATNIARAIGISDWIIGITIVAAGTSAPEMVTSILAAVKGKHGISAGNLIGSDIFNIIGVLGIASILNPLEIEPLAFNSLIMLLAMVILVIVFLRTGWQLSRSEGVIIVLFAIFRWSLDIAK